MSKKTKTLILILIMVLSVGYAMLESNISLSSLFNIRSSKFDVHFENISEEDNTKAYIDSEDNKKVHFNCSFDKPSDFYTFNVDVVNKGTIDAMVDDFKIEGLEDYSDLLEYEVVYDNKDVIQHGNLIMAGKKDTLVVTVRYKDDIEVLPDEEISSVELTFSVNYIMDDGTATPHKGYFVTESALNKYSFKDAYRNKNINSIIFTGDGVSDEQLALGMIYNPFIMNVNAASKYIDLSATKDKSILGWVDGNTLYVTAKEKGYKVKAPEDSSYLFGYKFGVSGTYIDVIKFTNLDVSFLDTSSVTNMNNMFINYSYGYSNVDSTAVYITGLEGFDTSKVETMSHMFEGTFNTKNISFSGLDTWDVSNVKDMSYMFSGAFDNGIGADLSGLANWDVSNVTDMSHMFESAFIYAKDFDFSFLTNWKTNNVNDLSYMFNHALYNVTNFALDLSNWNTSKVEKMSYLFSYTGIYSESWSIGDISSWNTSKVQCADYMFSEAAQKAQNLTLDVSRINLSSMTDISYMFYKFGTSSNLLNIVGLDKWDVSHIENMSGLFYYFAGSVPTYSFGNISGWDVSNVIDMSYMFASMGSNSSNTVFNPGDLSMWNVSKVENMSSMFRLSGNNAPGWYIGDISGWNVGKVKKFNYMFDTTCKNETNYTAGDFKNWDVSQAESFDYMFNNAFPYSSSFNIDLSKWNTGNAKSFSSMLSGVAYGTTDWNIGNLDNWDVSNAESLASLFSKIGGKSKDYFIGTLEKWDVSKCKRFGSMFSMFGKNLKSYNLKIDGWNTASAESMASMFNGAFYSFDPPIDLSNWTMDNVTTIENMFYECGRNTTVWSIGDLSKWNVSNIKSFASAFYYAGNSCKNFSLGDLSGWNVSQAQTFKYMFCNCARYAEKFYIGDISGWDTHNVTNMQSMFYQMAIHGDYALDLSSWDVTKVGSYYSGFNGSVTDKIIPPVWVK